MPIRSRIWLSFRSTQGQPNCLLGSCCSVVRLLCCVLCTFIVLWYICYIVMALTVYFLLMSLNAPSIFRLSFPILVNIIQSSARQFSTSTNVYLLHVLKTDMQLVKQNLHIIQELWRSSKFWTFFVFRFLLLDFLFRL